VAVAGPGYNGPWLEWTGIILFRASLLYKLLEYVSPLLFPLKQLELILLYFPAVLPNKTQSGFPRVAGCLNSALVCPLHHGKYPQKTVLCVCVAYCRWFRRTTRQWRRCLEPFQRTFSFHIL